MSQSTFCRYMAGSVLLICMLFLASTTRATAQDNCRCLPSEEQSQLIKICFGPTGSAFVKVTYCNESYCPPKDGVQPCNPNNLPISARTVIKSICPDGFTTTDAQGLMNATVAAIGICCGNGTFFPQCPESEHIFNWIVSWPKCVLFNADRCLVACLDAPCCTNLVQFERTGTGKCVTRVLSECPDDRACDADCITLDCKYPTKCCY